jgi:hypothetical protein
LRQQVFQQVVGKAAIAQFRRTRRRDGIGQARARLQLRKSQEAAIQANAQKLPLIVFNGCSPDVAPQTKHRDLPVFDRFLICHAKNGELGEVGSKDAGAVMQSLERNHQDQNAFHCQPAVGMFQEHGLHSAIRDGTDLGVIWWVKVQEREGFGPRNSVKGIALDSLDAVGTGNPRTFGVELDAIAPDLRVAGDEVQCSSLSNARVDHRSRFRKRKQ